MEMSWVCARCDVGVDVAGNPLDATAIPTLCYNCAEDALREWGEPMKRIETASDRLARGETHNFRVAMSWVLAMCEHEQNQVRRIWDGDTSPIIEACEDDARRALTIYEACMRAATAAAVEQMRAYADEQDRAYLEEIADALATGTYRHLAF